ncbi:MAG: M28 family metallopeptidase [Planctomycetota bacterium]
MSKIPRNLILCGPLVVVLLTTGLSVPTNTLGKKEWPGDVRKAFNSIKTQECYKHVEVLASDAYQGRAAGEEGGRLAAEYISRRFQEIGLVPSGTAGSYLQPFPINVRKRREGPLALSNRLWIRKKLKDNPVEFELGKDFLPHQLSAEAWASGPLAFLGSEVSSFDKVRGKIVLARVSMPSDSELIRPLVEALAAAGAKALLVIGPSAEELRGVENEWPKGVVDTATAIPVVRLSTKACDRLLGKYGQNLTRVVKLAATEIHGLGSGEVTLEVSRAGFLYGMGKNIVGVLRGSDPILRDEYIVVGAHYDHVGLAEDPRLTKGKPGEIHNGADDNASGSSGLIELAEAFAANNLVPKRSIVFISFDAEELGLLGSKHFVDAASIPLDRIKAMLNMDMISRNGPREMRYGSDARFPGLNSIAEGVAKYFDIYLNPEGMDEYMGRSDQAAFIERGIPAIFIYGGDHPQYHTEKDDVELIDPIKIQNISRLMFLCAYECAMHEGEFK